MAAAAAIILRKERDVVDLYRRAGATSPAAARAPDDLGVHHRLAFNILVRHGALREVGDRRFYLDEPRWQALRARRRRVAVTVFIVVIVLIAGLAAAGIISVGLGMPGLH